jgi:hypothetical protein
MYYFIQNSEDGIRITGCDHGEAMEHIKDLTSQDLRPECRAEFIDTIPNEYTSDRKVCVIWGDIIVPDEAKVVTEYRLPDRR